MLKLEFANCLSPRVASHGLDPARIQSGSELAKAAESLTASLAESRGTGWERWRELPSAMRDAHTKPIDALADKLKGRFTNLVVLGIGGSALGNIALQSALNSPTYNMLPNDQRPGPRLFVLDNVDPHNFNEVMRVIEASGGFESTCFNVISKSGETAETAAQFMWIRDKVHAALGDKAKDHIVAITDPEKGTMRTICDDAGYETLPVPEGVGGRFSVLSPVGLFSARMTGIDIHALLDGAAEMDERCSNPDLNSNPAAMLATLLVELAARKGKTNHVLMPYANQLYLLADWFRQLWAESLGKQRDVHGELVYAGFTPIKALGATDQHSQIQLYREGPNDKVIGLLAIDEFASDVTIPKGLNVDSINYLEGKSMADLLNAERRATEYALVESNRPNFTIRFPKLDAHHVGEFISLWQITTAYAGLMLGVDAYDQPAVETGKQATFGLMGREGYESYKTQVETTLTDSPHVI